MATASRRDELIEFGLNSARLTGFLALPERKSRTESPATVICHGFPTTELRADRVGLPYHSLADRIALDKGCPCLVVHLRGCGQSEGSFSLGGWLSDLQAACTYLKSRPEVSSVSIMGFGTGAALAICAGAQDREIRAVAAVAPPADFSDWSNEPDELLAHCRHLGLIKDSEFPDDFANWVNELGETRAVDAAGDLAPRPLLLIHGNQDEIVPTFDGRIIADSHGSAELRIIRGAGHLLRHDPRAVAILLGWVDRRRFAVLAS